MSCVLNTTLKRACRHFGELDEADLVETAKSLSVIDGFEKHECTIITRKYGSILVAKGVNYLRKGLIVDRGAIHKEHMDLEQLPANAELEDKHFVLQSPFSDTIPSENDCLQLWTSIFSVMVIR
jgi:hypothetical protein